MKWVLDNLWTLLIIAGVLAQLLQSIRSRKQEGEQGGPDEAPPREFESDDPELAERTRRIREEIQRKIAERRRGGAPIDQEAPPWETEPAGYGEEPPVVREVVLERPAPPPVMPAYGSRMETQRAAEILEQQAALAERLQQAQEMKAAAQRRAAFEARSVVPAVRARQAARSALSEDLRSPEALRRAVILREVLGPPVGLR
jgi:hypothetical protein